MFQYKEFKLKKELISKDILLRVCFTFIDKYYIYLDVDIENWIIRIRSKNESSFTLDDIEGEFRNSLINESLRDQLIKDTKVVKELIVTKALYGAKSEESLSKFNIINKEEALKNFKEKFVFNEAKVDDYINDPLGISLPWEQRNTNKQKDFIDKLEEPV